MKNLQSSFKSSVMLFYCLATLVSFNVSAQKNIAVTELITSNILTEKENKCVADILSDGFVAQHWIATVSLDPYANELEISLPEVGTMLFTLEKRREVASGLISWRGKSDQPGSSAILVWHNGMITAMISINPKLVYRIQPISANRHIIYRVNQKKAPNEESKEDYEKMKNRVWVPSEDMHSTNPEESKSNNLKFSGSDCYIKILVGFDNVAGPSLADPIGFAIGCIELSNEIYANSDVNFEVELALSKIYDDAASVDIDDALAEWQYDFGDGKFNDVFSDREQYDADFCILITENFDGDYVGLAATILASYSSAFCVVEDGAAIDNLSFTHEIGHLMGARHDLYVDGSGDYNHGYIIHSEEVRTVMAYNTECEDNGYDCERVRFFSNPDITYLGTGKALGDAAEEHNERALDENESVFKDFEPVVTNKVFLFPETVSGDIYGSITAISSIENKSIYEIIGNANVVWSAGDYMTLEENFVAQSGSTFEAKIAGCNATKLEDEQAETSLSEIESLNALLSPNPAAAYSTLSFTLSNDALIEISITDLAGKSLLSLVPVQLTAGTHDQQLDLNSLASGTYFVRLIANSKPFVKKLVIQH